MNLGQLGTALAMGIAAIACVGGSFTNGIT